MPPCGSRHATRPTPGTGGRVVRPAPPAAPLTRRAVLSSLLLLHPARSAAAAPPTLRYSDFLNELERPGAIKSVSPSSDASTLDVTRADGSRVRVTLPPPPPPPLGGDPDLLDKLLTKGVDVQRGGDGDAGPPSLFASATGAALAVATLTLLYRWLMGGGAGAEPSSSSSAPPGSPSAPSGFDPFRSGPLAGMRTTIKPVHSTTTFADVAGLETAKTELAEVVAFVKDPARFARLGARVPRGVLLTGPSGTGKTLLARAVAGESGVPFFSIAGSEFVEVFVGLGAARVRDLFTAARAAAPCVVLIDEIDAVGRQRGAGWGGGNDEREQTLNQLLTEMDGFDAAAQVVVLAATNRPDILDPALTRAGRFDRRVQLDLPDVAARTAILRLHARGKPIAADVDLPLLAQRTPGFSGAQLANVINEAAIGAARGARDAITESDIDAALERVLAGPERLSALVSPQRRRAVAVHEAGHALVATLVPDGDAVAKVSIVPRAGPAGGFGATFFVPDEATLAAGVYSKAKLEASMAVSLGGRVAEDAVLGEAAATTGGADDLAAVTRIARFMVEQCGMGGDAVGELAWAGAAGGGDHSEAVGAAIDAAVAAEVVKARETAERLIAANRPFLDAVVDALLDRETLTGEELLELASECGAVVV